MPFVVLLAAMGVDDYSTSVTMAMFNAEDDLMSCVDIMLITDAVFEGDESFTVTIDSSTPSLAVGWPPSSTTVMIDDSSGKYH